MAYFIDKTTGINNGMTANQRNYIAKLITRDEWNREFAYLLDIDLSRDEASQVIDQLKAIENILSLDVECLGGLNWETIMASVRKHINEIAPRSTYATTMVA